MSNVLSQRFGFRSIMRFTAPTIIMMVFMSLYTMVDGVFVSRFVGTDALSAVNIVYPILNVILAISIMLATGGSAIIARKMGQGKEAEARVNFSFLTLTGILIGVVLLVLLLVFLKPIIRLLGATESLVPLCEAYAKPLILFTPFGVLQMLFQYFFVTAGRPMLGLFATVAGGLANMVLDYVFIVPLRFGIAGAALATGIGFCIPAVIGLLFFAGNRKGSLYFVRPKYDGRVLWESCTNGSSEMVTNLSMAITTFLFNIYMLRYLGEDGVAAITIILYTQFLLTAVYLGYSSGIASVFSFNYGAGNVKQLQKLFQVSVLSIGVSSLFIFFAAFGLADPLITIFAEPGTNVFLYAERGFFLFSFSYLFIGANIFSSSLFTALGNGRISALISFLRTFVFLVMGIMLLPYVLEVDGIWLAVPFAELLTLVVSVLCILLYKKQYHYF